MELDRLQRAIAYYWTKCADEARIADGKEAEVSTTQLAILDELEKNGARDVCTAYRMVVSGKKVDEAEAARAVSALSDEDRSSANIVSVDDMDGDGLPETFVEYSKGSVVTDPPPDNMSAYCYRKDWGYVEFHTKTNLIEVKFSGGERALIKSVFYYIKASDALPGE